MDTLQRKTGQVFGKRAPHTGLQGLELYLKKTVTLLATAGAHAFKIISSFEKKIGTRSRREPPRSARDAKPHNAQALKTNPATL
jgi:hypothetical protein